jgi:hypothetical protein
VNSRKLLWIYLSPATVLANWWQSSGSHPFWDWYDKPRRKAMSDAVLAEMLADDPYDERNQQSEANGRALLRAESQWRAEWYKHLWPNARFYGIKVLVGTICWMYALWPILLLLAVLYRHVDIDVTIHWK